jgi:hypothetical protein
MAALARAPGQSFAAVIRLAPRVAKQYAGNLRESVGLDARARNKILSHIRRTLDLNGHFRRRVADVAAELSNCRKTLDVPASAAYAAR